MSTEQPYYRRYRPSPGLGINAFDTSGSIVDFRKVYEPPPDSDDHLAAVAAGRDDRAAAVIAAVAGRIGQAPARHTADELCERKEYDDETVTFLAPDLCLGALAYLDYFQSERPDRIKELVWAAIAKAQPGWSGTFGPGANQLRVILGGAAEGNYDMGQMCQVAIAYAFYEELSPAARERLIRELLGNGKIVRINCAPTATSGPLPKDWTRAGWIKFSYAFPHITGWGPGAHVKDIGETENHLFTMLAARYLANQLLFQRTRDEQYDNRRNGRNGAPSCTSLVLSLLRNVLRGDFSEYNAKNYQNETRWALLALCTYAYDHEVRLAARMVLDYCSAKMAISSSELRRLVPFRRLNKDPKNRHREDGAMLVGLTVFDDPDPMTAPFALQTGNTRECRVFVDERFAAGMNGWNKELTLEIVSDYRVPAPILDLLANNSNRRFFQRMHRQPITGEAGGNRNADNMEIYAGSLSYLITAGSAATDYAIDPRISPTAAATMIGAITGEVSGGISGGILGFAFGGVPGALIGIGLGALGGGISGAALGAALGKAVDLFARGLVLSDQDQQKGVAVTTSFMPAAGNDAVRAAVGGKPLDNAQQLIQFSIFSAEALPADDGQGVANYGVAPDFACGHVVHLPAWLTPKLEDGGDGWSFADFGSSEAGTATGPGFYLALLRSGGFALLEPFDTWLNPTVSYEDFKSGVRARNSQVRLNDNVEATYTTSNGNSITFVIWQNHQRLGAQRGAQVLSVIYADPSSPDARGDAGNTVRHLLNGTVINTEREAVISITNPARGTIRLDLSDPWRPRRTDESGVIEWAGDHEEVWADFEWKGKQEGDVCRPIATLAGATALVANHGTIRLIPSQTRERAPIGMGKRCTLVAPIGDVRIGVP